MVVRVDEVGSLDASVAVAPAAVDALLHLDLDLDLDADIGWQRVNGDDGVFHAAWKDPLSVLEPARLVLATLSRFVAGSVADALVATVSPSAEPMYRAGRLDTQAGSTGVAMSDHEVKYPPAEVAGVVGKPFRKALSCAAGVAERARHEAVPLRSGRRRSRCRRVDVRGARRHAGEPSARRRLARDARPERPPVLPDPRQELVAGAQSAGLQSSKGRER